MFTVSTHTTELLVEKQSKFIAHLMPYGTYKEVLAALKIEHPKARHFVTAFRYINEFDQVVEGSSDDGEPKGTSGKPTLAVLQGQELINVAVVIVRYFGGTKLGTGGLVRAYSDATNRVVESSELLVYKKETMRTISCSYSDMGKVEYAIAQHAIEITAKAFEAMSVKLHLQATSEVLDVCCDEVKRLVTIEER